MATITGINQLVSNLQSIQNVWDDPAIVNAGAAEIVKIQQENVRKKLNKNAHGVLESKLQVIEIDSRNAEAGIPENTLAYQLVHEFGKKIVPKKAKALRFEIDGKVIYVKSVTIPARPFVRPSAKPGGRKAAMAILKMTRKKINEGIK